MKNTWMSSDLGFFVFRNIVEQVADHIMVTDKQGFIEYVNPAFERTTGWTSKEVLGQNPRFLQSGQQSIEYYRSLWGTILSGKVFYAHTINKKKNGQLYVADQTVSPIFNEAHEITHFVSVWKDITDSVRIQERLTFEREKLEEIIGFDEKLSRIRKSDQLVDFVVSKTKRILEADQCSVMLVDEETKELCVKSTDGFAEDAPMRIKIAGSIAQQVFESAQALLIKDIHSADVEQGMLGNSYLQGSFMIAPITIEKKVIGVINVAAKHSHLAGSDVFDEIDLKILSAIAKEMAVAIENVAFYKELHYLTVTDPLTHMHNYRHFVNTIDYELKRLKRFPGELSVLMIDIDGFKAYNDHLGHLAGDELLKEIGQMIHLNLREVDVLCRYGGDEFVIILPGTDSEGAMVIADKIRRCIDHAIFQQKVTLSIGVCAYREKMTRHEITFKADKALYQAKHEGKNRVCLFGQD